MGTYIIATLLFLALAYALYKIFSKRGKCCGNCGCCGNDSDGCCGGGGNCCGGHHHDHEKQDYIPAPVIPFRTCKPFSAVCRFFCYGACRSQPLPCHSIQPC